MRTFVNISSACDYPSQYLAWDGFHPTQALNRQLAIFFLNGKIVEGPTGSFNLSLFCNLNFTSFRDYGCSCHLVSGSVEDVDIRSLNWKGKTSCKER